MSSLNQQNQFQSAANIQNSNELALDEVPVINLSDAFNPALQGEFDERLRHITREIGFFYLTGHGVPPEQIKAVSNIAKQFFALPIDAKQSINMENSKHFRGYTAVDEETTRGKADHREQIDIGAELEVDPLVNSNELWRNLQGPNQWPDELPELKPLILDWVNTMRALAKDVLTVFLRALDQDESVVQELIEGKPSHLLKLIHYPGTQTNPQGVGAHKDSGLLTLLLQDEIGGLQIETDTGWIDAPYLENAFIVNIGETLELLTNGYLRANVHRVIAPPKGISRYSNAFFLAPRLDLGELTLLKLPDSLAKLAKGPTSDPLNPLFQHVGTNAIKGRLRSHLSVTKRFYPDYFAAM